MWHSRSIAVLNVATKRHLPECAFLKANSYRCPDVLVVRGEPRFRNEEKNAVANPAVIVEVLSDATTYDEFFWRSEEGWLLRDYQGLDASIDLDTVGVKLPLRAIDHGVDLPPASA